jgi:hypothetical protein
MLMNGEQRDPVIHLWQAERDALGLMPDDGSFTLSQASQVVHLAKQSRSSYLGGEPTRHVRPGDFYRMYDLGIEQRIGAALTTSIIERVTTQALGAAAAEMALQREAVTL